MDALAVDSRQQHGRLGWNAMESQLQMSRNIECWDYASLHPSLPYWRMFQSIMAKHERIRLATIPAVWYIFIVSIRHSRNGNGQQANRGNKFFVLKHDKPLLVMKMLKQVRYWTLTGILQSL